MVPLGEILLKFRPNLPRGDVLSSRGGVWTVERIVASEVDQCHICPADLKEGVDNDA